MKITKFKLISIGKPFHLHTPFGTLKGKVVDEATAEQLGDIVVCVKATDFHDPLTATHTLCACCGEHIVYGPTSPKAPPKVCLNCFINGSWQTVCRTRP